MKFTHRTKLFGALLLSFFVLNGVNATPAFAEKKLDPIRIQISPANHKISLEPGANYTGSFKVQNAGSENFKYKLSATPYQVEGERYQPVYNRENKYTQIANWVTFDHNSGSLSPNETKEVFYTIKVPKDVPAGGQYAALMAEVENASNSGVIKAGSRVGMILYSRVSGHTREEAKVLNNNISGFFLNPPISVTSLVENTGNVDITAKYTLNISSFFSGQEVYSNSNSPEERSILPETKYFNTLSWTGGPLLGLFHVEQIVELPGKTPVTTKKVVLICPIWLIALLIIGLFAIIFRIMSQIKSKK